MKFFPRRAVCGLLLLSAHFCWPATAADPSPQIVCDAPVYDFGTVDGKAPIRHTFSIRNKGGADLVIKKIHIPCGCTTAQVQDKLIPPGGETTIPVNLTLKGRRGFQQKSIYVESNDTGNGNLPLTLRGSVGVAVDIRPPYLVMRKAAAGEPVAGSVTLSEPSGKSFRVLESASQSGALDLTAVPDGGAWRIHATLREKFSPGQHGDKITLKTDLPGGDAIAIEALILVAGDVAAIPDALSFEENAAASATRTVIVKSEDLKDLTIESVDVPVDSMTTKIERTGTSAFRVTIGNIRPIRDLDKKSIRIRTGGSEPHLLNVAIGISSPQSSR
jgi:hypothetical protein